MELGFLFHSPENSQAIGHPQLDANLYEIPTGEHFDPYQLTLPVETENEGVKNTSFYHPADSGSYRVGVGRIILADQEEKEIEAFIFGGELEISVFPERSFCQIRSSAPIFYVNRFAEDELGLVNEYEGELARLRAAWKHATPDFDQRLAQIDPKTLFIALTAAIEERQRLLPAIARNESYWEFRRSLHAALRFVEPEGGFPPDVITIKHLFYD